MRFACVRNNTNSGLPWDPAVRGPNYLCAESEIDSLGTATWATALNGKLFPYPWLVDGRGLAPKSGRIQKLRGRLTARRQKVPFRQLEALKDFDTVLVVQHASVQYDMSRFILEARKKFPNTVFIGRPGNSMEYLRRFWNIKEGYLAYAQFVRQCDIHLTQDLGTESYYESLFGVPTVYMPPFYPTDYVRQFFKPREQKEKIILIGSEPHRDDWLWSCAIARAIQRRHPDFRIHVSTWSKGKHIDPYALSGSAYEVLPPMPWRQFLAEVARSYLVINTDTIWTCGRLCEDGAALGSPNIGVNADMQLRLFPDLIIGEMMGTTQALELADRLIDDPEFYDRVQQKALSRVGEVSYENSARRLTDLVQAHRSGRMAEWKPWNPDAPLIPMPVEPRLVEAK